MDFAFEGPRVNVIGLEPSLRRLIRVISPAIEWQGDYYVLHGGRVLNGPEAASDYAGKLLEVRSAAEDSGWFCLRPNPYNFTDEEERDFKAKVRLIEKLQINTDDCTDPWRNNRFGDWLRCKNGDLPRDPQQQMLTFYRKLIEGDGVDFWIHLSSAFPDLFFEGTGAHAIDAYQRWTLQNGVARFIDDHTWDKFSICVYTRNGIDFDPPQTYMDFGPDNDVEIGHPNEKQDNSVFGEYDPNAHRVIRMPRRGVNVEIDIDIAPLIDAMWSADIATTNSCQEVRPGWVWIEFRTAKDAERFLDVVAFKEEGVDSLYERICHGRLRADGTNPQGLWEYDVSIHNCATDHTEVKDSVAEEIGKRAASFVFNVSVRFPRTDLQIIEERLRKHNMEELKRSVRASLEDKH
jgi:hypothetical protein